MPNWVKNVVTVSEDTMNKIKEKYFTDGVLDFNKIIPMPKTLDISDSSITERAILYALSKKDSEKSLEIIEVLKNKEEVLYSNYWEKLQKFSEYDIEKLENVAKNYTPGNEERELGIKTLEDFGNVCLNNILEYGHVTWYDWCVDNWGTKWDASEFTCNKTTMIFETAWSTPEPIFEKLSEEFPDEFIEVKYADECYSNYNNGMLTFKGGLCDYSTDMDEDFAAEVWNEEIENEENEKDITDEMFD